MNCPKCRKDSKVIDSRPAAYGSEVARRRKCKSPVCSFIFTTIERTAAVKVGDQSRLNRLAIIRKAAKAVQQKEEVTP